jgi:hypothetical protein
MGEREMKLTNKILKNMIKEVISEGTVFRTSKSSYAMERLNETTMTALQDKYMKSGFIVITSDRTCQAELGLPYGAPCPPEAEAEQEIKNQQNRESMKQEIRAAGFGFTPVMGGYKEKLVDPETGAVTRVDTDKPEHGFLVMAQPGRPGLGIEELKNLAMELSVKYNQDVFFLKPPDSETTDAYYLKRDGSIDMTFTDFKFGDLSQEYYTQLAKGSEKHHPKKRFTGIMESMMVPRPPSSATEARLRRGEIFAYKPRGINERN